MFSRAIFWFTLVCVPNSYLDVSKNQYFIYLALALRWIGPGKVTNRISQTLYLSFHIMRLVEREQSNTHTSAVSDQTQNSNCEYWIHSSLFLADGKESDSKSDIGG